MTHFLYKLVPPRATFPMDMSDAEADVMHAHFGYWAEVIAQRKAVAYGPVGDPRGTYGVAILDVTDEDTARQVIRSDPAVLSQVGFDFELHPMPDAIVRT
jgi:uncharacterized protein